VVNEFQKPYSKAVTEERWREIFGEVDEKPLDDDLSWTVGSGPHKRNRPDRDCIPPADSDSA
jgi:hypothetical protein